MMPWTAVTGIMKKAAITQNSAHMAITRPAREAGGAWTGGLSHWVE